MLESISWLVYGPKNIEKRLSPIVLTAKMLEVNQYRQRKDVQSFEYYKEQGKNLLKGIRNSDVLVEIFQEYIVHKTGQYIIADSLLEIDEPLCYFVVFCTAHLYSSVFLSSFHKTLLEQELIAGDLHLRVERIPGTHFLFNNGVPWLPWDLTPVLENFSFAEPIQDIVIDSIGTPINTNGQLHFKMIKMLKNQCLRKVRRLYHSFSPTAEAGANVVLERHIFDRSTMISNLISMYENVDSDLFLKDKSGKFILKENSEIEDGATLYQLMETAAILQAHIQEANEFLNLKQIFSCNKVYLSRGIIVNSCNVQIEMMGTVMRAVAKEERALHQILLKLLDVVRYKYTLLLFCQDLISLAKGYSDYEMSELLSKAYAFSGHPQYKSILVDLNRYIIQSWTRYLAQPDEPTSNENYVRLFCGNKDEVQDKKISEIVYTCRLLRTMKNNLHSTDDYDQLYEESIKEATNFENVENILKSIDPTNLQIILTSVLRPYSSPKAMSALVTDYLDAMKLIAVVFLPLSSYRMLQDKEINMNNLLSLGISRRHILKLKYSNNSIVYEAPPPLNLIITANHSTRIQNTREQFLVLSSAYKALLEINLRDNLFCPGEDRIAFFRRNKMISIVRSLLNHVVYMVRNIRDEMEEELKKATVFLDLINVQRRMMRHLFHRTRLETKNNSTASIISKMADSSSRFANAFTKGDARSCEHHYYEFYGNIRVLTEKLYSETDNYYAQIILVQLDKWNFLDTRRSETTSSRSMLSLETTR